MNFMQLIQSLDDLLYKIMSWLVFFPVTLWRTITRPLAMMEYAVRELDKPADKQFSETLSPPLFLLLALLISHGLELASGGGTNPVVADRQGLAAYVDSDTKLLLLRLVIFSLIPLMLATVSVVARKTMLSDETLQGPFYAQCYPAAPFALTVGIGTLLLNNVPGYRPVGGMILLLAIVLYGTAQALWFRRRLECGALVATAYASGAIIFGLVFAVLIGVLFI